MYLPFLSTMTKTNKLFGSDGVPYTYNIFFFKGEPMSIWRIADDGSEVVEFVEKVGWSKNSSAEDYRSDIENSVSSITAYYHELPMVILEMLEGFPC